MNAPAWLRCEHCLWWKSAADPGEGWGCTYAGIPKPMAAFDRCHLWTCKRCFRSWNTCNTWGLNDDSGPDGIINHLYCKKEGRGKPRKAKL